MSKHISEEELKTLVYRTILHVCRDLLFSTGEGSPADMDLKQVEDTARKYRRRLTRILTLVKRRKAERG